MPDYDAILAEMVGLLESARRTSARAVNTVMTVAYWEIGRRIVEYEQGGEGRAEYGAKLMVLLAADLTQRFGRGFSKRNLELMRLFYLKWPIAQTVSAQFSPQSQQSSTSDRSAAQEATNRQSLPGKLVGTSHRDLQGRFSLPWSHYVQLLKVDNHDARTFYEAEALRNGWSVRQLERQITTLFYERALASRNKAAMLRKGAVTRPEDVLTPEEEIKDPLVLEFLGLKDEYSESELEEALIQHLETFLLELGSDFAFIGRQRRLRVGDEWYRIDLLFYHRRLRCLVVVDLKLGKFTHADAGQMHLYLTYAQEHWTHPDENPPVGVILCTQKDQAVVHYSLDTLPNKVLAAEYRTTLPDEKTLLAELERSRRTLESGRSVNRKGPPNR